jgi:O-antigen ligase
MVARTPQPLVLAALGAGVLALNAAIGGAVIVLGPTAAAVAFVPAALLAFGALVAWSRVALVFLAFALDLSGVEELRYPLATGTGITAPDLLVLLALGSWAAEALLRRDGTPRWPRTPVLGPPFALFAVFLVVAIVRGQVAYGAPLLGQPLRFVLYAGIAAALAGLSARTIYGAVVAVFYLATLWKVTLALVYLTTGAQPFADHLRATGISTGGERVLGVTTAIYMTGALVLALLNVELTRAAGRRVLHFAVALLALFGVVVTYGRAAYVAAAIVVTLLFLTRPALRRAVASVMPVFVPLFVLVGVVLPLAIPDLVPTAIDRVSGDVNSDASWRWREAAYLAVLGQFQENPLIGVGFGKTETFTVDFMRHTITQDPHNSFLFLLGGGGALTLGSFLLLLAVFFVDAIRRMRSSDGTERALVTFAVSLVVVFCVNALAEPQLTQPASLLAFWTALLLPAAAARRS